MLCDLSYPENTMKKLFIILSLVFVVSLYYVSVPFFNVFNLCEEGM